MEIKDMTNDQFKEHNKDFISKDLVVMLLRNEHLTKEEIEKIILGEPTKEKN